MANTAIRLYYLWRVWQARYQYIRIQTMVYYPISVNNQIAYRHFFSSKMNFPVSEGLCKKVLALPIHSEMNMSDAEFVCSKIEEFYNK